jgi:hypothetical protein
MKGCISKVKYFKGRNIVNEDKLLKKTTTKKNAATFGINFATRKL